MIDAHAHNCSDKMEESPASHVEDKSELRDNFSHPPLLSRPSVMYSAAERARRNINARLANPLQRYSHHELQKMGRSYANDNGLAERDDIRALEIGACLARDADNLRHAKRLGVTDEELLVLEREITHRWSQPLRMYLVIVLCSACAAVQGMGTSSNQPFVAACSQCNRRNCR